MLVTLSVLALQPIMLVKLCLNAPYMLSKQKKKIYKIKIGIFWKSKMAAGGHIEIWGCVLVSIIESNTIVWHMVSMCFSTNKLIYGIKFQLWVQIQDGRRTPYWILQKKVIQSYGAGIQKVDLQTTCFTSIWCELGKSKRCMVKKRPFQNPRWLPVAIW